MGMDVYGINPLSESGKYFRANIWSWRPIVAIMRLSGFDVPSSWSYNDGDGLREQSECNALADKIESFMNNADDSDLELPAPDGLGIDENGIFGKGKKSPYYTTREHVARWVAFLRNCGGFEIC